MQEFTELDYEKLLEEESDREIPPENPKQQQDQLTLVEEVDLDNNNDQDQELFNLIDPNQNSQDETEIARKIKTNETSSDQEMIKLMENEANDFDFGELDNSKHKKFIEEEEGSDFDEAEL